MELDKKLLDEFADATYDKTPKVSEITCYGEAVIQDSKEYVMIDGAETLTPAIFAVRAHHGDRVMVLLKNHQATVIGNITTPSMTLGILNVTDGIIVQGYLTTNEERVTYDDLGHTGLTFSGGGIGAYGGSGKYWYVTNTGDLYASSAELVGKITATSGYLGSASKGFIIDESGIYSGKKDGTADGNITLSNSNFSRTINNVGHSNLRFAIGSKFAVASDGTLYAVNGEFEGKITATSGYLGSASKGFIIDESGIYSGTKSGTSDGDITLSTIDLNRVIDGTSVNNLRFLIGENFAVAKDGSVYISGKITATSGYLGSVAKGFIIDESGIYSGKKDGTADGNITLSNSTFSRSIGGSSRDNLRLAIGGNFGVNSSGVIYASGANVSGNITATTLTATNSGTIGPWTISSTALYYKNATFGDASGIYIGTSGISLSDKFKVTSTGALTATSGTIGGWTIGTNILNASKTVNGTTYSAFLQNPGTDADVNRIAFGLSVVSSSGTTYPFRVNYDGALTATKATISGTIYATLGEIGGFTIDSTSIHTKGIAVESNAEGSLAISSSTFTRTVGGISQSDLKFAIGSAFCVTALGEVHVGSLIIVDSAWASTGRAAGAVIDFRCDGSQVGMIGSRVTAVGDKELRIHSVADINISAGYIYMFTNSGFAVNGQIITSFKNSIAMGSYGSTQTTVPNLCEEVRYSSGCSGSAYLQAYTNGITIAAGWYNFLWMPHRSGGVNGGPSGDNCNFGSLLLSGMTVSGCYIIRISSASIVEVRNVYANTTYSAGTGISLSGTTFTNSGVTGIKGNSETSYRTGSVNLTAANIGALALSGGTLSGALAINSTLAATGDVTFGSDSAVNRFVYCKNSHQTIAMRVNSTGDGAGLRLVRTNDAANDKWMIYSNKTGTISVNTSDIREKNVIGNMPKNEAEQILKGVDIINFIYKTDDSRTIQNGVSAQQLRDVLIKNQIGYRPYLALHAEDGSFYYDLTVPEDRVSYGVDYGRFTPLLWKGWQIHNGRIENHEDRITALERENAALKEEIRLLKVS